jgi:Cu/Zn superoxide dismutase
MKQMHIPRRLMLSASVAAVLAISGLSASAQTATPTTSTAASPTTSAHAGDLTSSITAPKGAATAQMIQEACQRQRARTAKFVHSGIPEKWGSEEPFVFDPNTPCP